MANLVAAPDLASFWGSVSARLSWPSQHKLGANQFRTLAWALNWPALNQAQKAQKAREAAEKRPATPRAFERTRRGLIAGLSRPCRPCRPCQRCQRRAVSSNASRQNRKPGRRRQYITLAYLNFICFPCLRRRRDQLNVSPAAKLVGSNLASAFAYRQCCCYLWPAQLASQCRPAVALFRLRPWRVASLARPDGSLVSIICPAGAPNARGQYSFVPAGKLANQRPASRQLQPASHWQS